MRALQTAATGMMAQELNVQVISNNIANVRTTGYKRQKIHFQDLLYEHFRRAGSATSDQNTQVPAGTFVGSGVKTVSTGRVMTQGNLTPTEKQYDVAIRGEGFFRIRMPDGTTAFSRDGSFDLDAQGQLVTRDGYQVEPGITIPNNATGVSINAQGTVEVTVPGQTAPQQVGQLQLARFINKVGLESIGDNLFRETAASGQPIDGLGGGEGFGTLQLVRFVNKVGLESIGDNLYIETAASGQPIDGFGGGEGFGTLQQNYLEEGNVQAVTELSQLIAAQRAYEMNSKVITAADQMMSATSQMFRG